MPSRLRPAFPAFLALCLLLSGAHAAEPLKRSRPNVVLICIDDLKPALGCYGDEHARTPHIDRLATQSVLFANAYANQAVCAPSRNALLTGLRPDTLGIYELTTFFRHAVPDVVTLPQYFKNHGYHATGIGKILHEGQGNKDDALSWSAPHWKPTGSYYVLPENAGARDDGSGPPTENADVPDDAYFDGQVAAEAIRRIETSAATPDQPFFLAVGFIRPHLPFTAPKKYWDLYDPAKLPLAARTTPPDGAPAYSGNPGAELRLFYKGIPKQGPLAPELQRHLIHGYYAATSYADAQVGRVLDALDRTGLRQNTIIVLWGDHGFHLGDHGYWTKHTNYENAARIPLLISAPGHAPARTAGFIETVDLYPTLATLAGLPAPAANDGLSQFPTLRDPAHTTRTHAFHLFPRGKAGSPDQRLGRALRDARYRFVEWKKLNGPDAAPAYELYDYQTDPLETKNLAAAQPEVIARFRALLDTYPAPRPPLIR